MQEIDQVGRAFLLQEFRIRYLTLTGIEFQNLFADVMQNAWPSDFQKVKPYGRYGDLKCDGYLVSRKCVFQCYAPSRLQEAKVIAKIREDFLGAIKHWEGKIKEWCFVHNDRDGLTGNTLQAFENLRAEHSSLKINEWTWSQLREQFDRLPKSAAVELFGYPPMAISFGELTFEKLRPVVQAIARQKPNLRVSLSKVPSMQKLKKNSLDQDATAFLAIGRQRVKLVEEYFHQHHDPDLADQIAETISKQYQMLVDRGLPPNEILVDLQRFAGWGSGTTNSHNAAVLAVIMYFFDRCDIFEDPDVDIDKEYV